MQRGARMSNTEKVTCRMVRKVALSIGRILEFRDCFFPIAFQHILEPVARSRIAIESRLWTGVISVAKIISQDSLTSCVLRS
jgi:hypothetical protein